MANEMALIPNWDFPATHGQRTDYPAPYSSQPLPLKEKCTAAFFSSSPHEYGIKHFPRPVCPLPPLLQSPAPDTIPHSFTLMLEQFLVH